MIPVRETSITVSQRIMILVRETSVTVSERIISRAVESQESTQMAVQAVLGATDGERPR